MNDQKTFFKPEGRNTLGGKALRRYTTGFTYTSFVGKRKIYRNKKQNKTKQNTHFSDTLSQSIVLQLISYLVFSFVYD